MQSCATCANPARQLGTAQTGSLSRRHEEPFNIFHQLSVPISVHSLNL
jgi:hypothetical protein